MKQAGISKLEKIELRTRLRKFIAEETDIRNLPVDLRFKLYKEHRLARPQQVLQTLLPRPRLQEDVLWVRPKVQLSRPHPGVLLLQLQQAAVQGMCSGETHASSHG